MLNSPRALTEEEAAVLGSFLAGFDQVELFFDRGRMLFASFPDAEQASDAMSKLAENSLKGEGPAEGACGDRSERRDGDGDSDSAVDGAHASATAAADAADAGAAARQRCLLPPLDVRYCIRVETGVSIHMAADS